MSMIHNEQTKLTANAFNSAATSCFTMGVLAPLAAAFYNFGPTRASSLTIGAGVAIWLAAATVLHYHGRRLLGGLQP